MDRQLFCEDWTFRKADGGERKLVTLPHDAMQAETRDPKCASGSAGAYYPGGVYIYEKSFEAPKEWADKHVLLQFEGVYKNSQVSLNGKGIGGAAYGYIPFFVCLDDGLKAGETNTITVTVNNEDQPNSRWYTGSGIYRPVWLLVGERNGIEPEGIRVTTLSVKPAKIRVETECGAGEVQVEILDGSKLIAAGAGENTEIEIPGAKMWDENTPYLYTCRVILKRQGIEIDREEVNFGIRKLEWSNQGFFVNGKQTLLRGGCVHHDNGILGAATYAESEWRRARLLKEAGYNAIRAAHNPASAAMLEACDALGLYVMDETWDMWYSHKSKYDYASDFIANYKEDVRAIVKRDYNHASVVMYSIGNEVSEPATGKGVKLAKELVELFHSLDSTRPVTGGFNLMIITNAAKGKAVYKEEGGRDDSGDEKIGKMNSTMFNFITSMVGTSMNKAANSKKADAATSPCLGVLDIAGYNYASGRYPLEGRAHPGRIIYGSETFPQDIAKNWAMVKQYPYLIGDFMWTAWDYLGEAGIGTWAYTNDAKNFNKPYPWLLGDVGAMDILGNPNGQLFWAQAAWGLLKKPVIAVQPVNHPKVKPIKGAWRGTNALPSWSWSGCDGNKAVVEVYTDAVSVELKQNGKSLGKAKVKECRAIFKLNYAPGSLEAVAFDEVGKETGRSILESAKAADLQVRPEKNTVLPGEVMYIPMEIGDGKQVESNADRKLSVTVQGGELLAFGSANPRTEERFISGSYTSYYGHAMAVVRAGEAGEMTVTVQDGKKSVSVKVAVR